jgi:phosphate transport system substrate-binding protein
MFARFTFKIALISLILSTISGHNSYAGDQIRVVGSSTVYPFTTVVAEEFGQSGKFKSPIVESTGTGGGFKLFCAGVGEEFTDMSDASRAIKDSEREMCAQNNVKEITEIKIGYDGIVIANNVKSEQFNLTKTQIFLALARKIPVNGKLVDNNYKNWSDIDKSLPETKIEVYGPPPTSGTRDAFVEMVMDVACEEIQEYISAYPDQKDRKKFCQLIREDGAYIEAGENDNLIVQKIESNPDAFGIFGYSFLEENSNRIQGSIINGVEPEFDNISSGEYSISRPLYVYVKNAHYNVTLGLKEFVKELVSNDALGPDGYLSFKGLVPMGSEEFKEQELRVMKAMK